MLLLSPNSVTNLHQTHFDMKISKNPNLTDYSEDDSIPTLDRCKFWNSLLSSRKYHNLSATTASSDLSSPFRRKNLNEDDLLPTSIQFRRVCKFWNSIHKFVRKHFERSTITARSDTSSTNPNNIGSLPNLPFDLITEILSRLPVKLLLQLRPVCKSWNSLIANDSRFAKKHLINSTTHPISSLNFNDPYSLIIYPPNFFFDPTTVSTKQISYHSSDFYWEKVIVGSCNGVLCIAYNQFILLWNPSIRKSKELPLLPKTRVITYGFGYDSVADHYKVVVVLGKGCGSEKTQVEVYTMGTDIWKNIGEFPFGTLPDDDNKSGKYVSGTINWLASSQHIIVSLDLSNESYQKLLLPPDYAEVKAETFLALTLDVLRDCLCIISGHDHDVWLMKEYGKQESWTKLFTISYKQDPSLSFFLQKVIYDFGNGQVLLQMKMPFFRPQLIVYDPRIGTFNFVTFPKSFYSRSGVLDVSKFGGLVIYTESLISPCS